MVFGSGWGLVCLFEFGASVRTRVGAGDVIVSRIGGVSGCFRFGFGFGFGFGLGFELLLGLGLGLAFFLGELVQCLDLDWARPGVFFWVGVGEGVGFGFGLVSGLVLGLVLGADSVSGLRLCLVFGCAFGFCIRLRVSIRCGVAVWGWGLGLIWALFFGLGLGLRSVLGWVWLRG